MRSAAADKMFAANANSASAVCAASASFIKIFDALNNSLGVFLLALAGSVRLCRLLQAPLASDRV